MFENYKTIVDKKEHPEKYDKQPPKSYKNTMKYFKVSKITPKKSY
jgi:hypothetical protein